MFWKKSYDGEQIQPIQIKSLGFWGLGLIIFYYYSQIKKRIYSWKN